MDITHMVELAVLVIGGVAGIIRLLPAFREAAVFFQIALFLTEMFGFYIRKSPGQKKRLQYFVTDVFDHYLKTHPHGRLIAEKTDIDEKVEKFRNKHHPMKSDTHHAFHKYLGIEVDNTEK